MASEMASADFDVSCRCLDELQGLVERGMAVSVAVDLRRRSGQRSEDPNPSPVEGSPAVGRSRSLRRFARRLDQ
jgi:hypothetical protein